MVGIIIQGNIELACTMSSCISTVSLNKLLFENTLRFFFTRQSMVIALFSCSGIRLGSLCG